MRSFFSPVIPLLWLLMPTPAVANLAASFETLESCLEALAQPAPQLPSALPALLRVGSWNVMKEQRSGAAQQLKEWSARTDLFLTQEALRRSGNPSAGGFRFFAPGYDRGDVLTGVALKSVAPADTLCTLQFIEPILRTPKAVLAARLNHAGRALLVVNMHGINFTLDSVAYRRQLHAVARLVETHTGPVLVAGDMNHWNPWRRRTLRDFAASADLVEAEFSPDLRSRHLGSVVDTAYVRELDILSAEALVTPLSDHNPVVLLLRPQETREVDNHAAGVLRAPGR